MFVSPAFVGTCYLHPLLPGSFTMHGLSRVYGGLAGLLALTQTTGPDGLPLLHRGNLSSLGIREGTHPEFRAVMAPAPDHRKDEYGEIYRLGYFPTPDADNILSVYHWELSRPTITTYLAPLAMGIFDNTAGDVMTSSLADLAGGGQPQLPYGRLFVDWLVNRMLFRADPQRSIVKNDVMIKVGLLSRRREPGAQWRLRDATSTIDDFAVSPNGRLVVISSGWAFEVSPTVFVRAVMGAGRLDEDFVNLPSHRGIWVGVHAVLTRYTPPGYPFNIAVYDRGVLKVFDPETTQCLISLPSEHFVMTSADGTGNMIYVHKAGERHRLIRHTTLADQATIPSVH